MNVDPFISDKLDAVIDKLSNPSEDDWEHLENVKHPLTGRTKQYPVLPKESGITFDGLREHMDIDPSDKYGIKKLLELIPLKGLRTQKVTMYMYDTDNDDKRLKVNGRPTRYVLPGMGRRRGRPSGNKS